MNRNLWIITLSQIFSFTPAPINVFLSGIIGSTLSPVKALQTVPTSLMIVGIAVFSFFAAKIMSIIGRKAGFLLASLFSTFSALLAAYAIWDKNFYLFCLSCFLIGNGMSFTHQYRFAAAESVEKEFIPHLNTEHDGYAWVSFGNWPKPLHQGLRKTFQNKTNQIKLDTVFKMLRLIK